MPFDDIVAYSRLKINKLRELIRINYDIGPVNEINSLSFGINDVYQINCNNSRYILRITNVMSFWQYSKDDYLTELALLNYIKKEDNIVSYPIAKVDGDFLGEITVPEGIRYYVLFNYARGKPLNYLTNEQAYSYGLTLSKLHQKMTGFTRTHQHVHRFTHDLESLYFRPIELIRKYGISSSDLNFLTSLKEDLIPPIAVLAKNSRSFGLIHGDYQVRNSHYSHNENTPIIFDFDYMSFSWRMIDVANFTGATKFFLGSSLDEGFETSFLEGYSVDGQLNKDELHSLKYFEIAIGVSVIGQVVSKRELQSDRSVSNFISGALRLLQRLHTELP